MPKFAHIILCFAVFCVTGFKEPEQARADQKKPSIVESSQSSEIRHVNENRDPEYGPTDTREFELKASDHRLNTTYGNLIRRLRSEDQLLLRSAQRLWIKFRDADCNVAYVDKRECLMARTDEREVQLRNSLYFGRDVEIIVLPEPGD